MTIMAQQFNRTAQFGEQAPSTYEDVKHQVGDAYHQTEELVRRNPGYSALTTFGVGFGLGLLMTAMLMPPRRRTWYDTAREYMPRTPDMSHMSNAISRYLPDSVSRYL
jgi:hypothetical protein